MMATSEPTPPTGSERVGFFKERNRQERAKRALGLLSAAQRSASLYPDQHPVLAESIEAFFASIGDLVTQGEPATFNFHRGSIFFGNVVLPQESIMHSRLAASARQQLAGSITFLPGVTKDEVASLVMLLNRDEEAAKTQDSADWLVAHGVSHVQVGAVSESLEAAAGAQSDDEQEGAGVDSHRVGQEASEVYRLTVEAMRVLEEQVRTGKALEVARARTLADAMLDLMLQDRGAVIALATIRSHDEYTLFHSMNVMILSLGLGTMLPLEAGQLRELGLAALLHDVGKITVPQEILRKPGPLTTEEWKAMRRHPTNGAHLLDGLEGAGKAMMIVAFEHHMRHDLQGYPQPFDRQQLHLFSRVVAIADAYDAMTTMRAYRASLRPDKAVAVLLRESRRAFDPTLVKVFINMLGIYPVGSVVRLSTGEVAVVYEANPNDLLRPKVRIAIDENGRKVDGDVVDLTEIAGDQTSFARSVAECVDEIDAGVDAAALIQR